MLDSRTYVDEAEKIIQSLMVTDPRDGRRQKNKEVTANQVRNILSLFNELYDMVRNDPAQELDPSVISHMQYVRMRIVYSAGRDGKVRTFVEKSKLLEHLKETGSRRSDLLLLCRYMEALTAYHKFYELGSEK